MSYFVEKTLASIPNIISSSFASTCDFRKSCTFQNFIRSVSNIKSKHEEEEFVRKELSFQKEKLSHAKLTETEKREGLCRLAYCQMLGYDVSFCFIHAIQLAQSKNHLAKGIGYLMCSLFLHDQHELVVLLINTIQLDLRSPDRRVSCLALTAVTQLVGTELVPALLPLVCEKLSQNPEVCVRKRAIGCLHHMLRRVPSMHSHMEPHFRAALRCGDVGVIGAALHAYIDLVKDDPAPYRDLVPDLVDLLGRVTSRKMSADYEHHGVPAPWLSIQLLKLLARLGAEDKQCSEQIYPTLRDVLRKTEPRHKIGLAVIYECLETCAALYPEPSLVQLASRCVCRFLSSKNINLKYLGLKALISLVRVSPQYAAEHQSLLLDCLEHDDDSIRRKTLQLLYRIASPVNVVVIADRLLQQLDHSATDRRMRAAIIDNVADLAKRLAPDGIWYVETINKLMSLSEGGRPLTEVQHDLINYLRNTYRDAPDGGRTVLTHAVSSYWLLLQRDALPDILLQAAVWVVGEYSHLSESLPPDGAGVLCALFRSASDDDARLWILTALRKWLPRLSPPQRRLVADLCTDASTSSQLVNQLVRELTSLVDCSQQILDDVCLPENVDVDSLDFSLSFLDDFVSESLESGGGRPYTPRGARCPQPTPVSSLPDCRLDGVRAESSGSGQSGQRSVDGTRPAGGVWSAVSSSSVSDTTSLKTAAVKKVWGPDGLLKQSKASSADEQSTERDDVKTVGAEAESRDEPPMTDGRVERRQLASLLFGGEQSDVT